MGGIYAGAAPGQNNATGFEVVPMDLPQETSNTMPETVMMSAMQIAGSQPIEFKNSIIGGNFGTNPWQRGTSFAAIANTLTYTADRFFAVGGASSSIFVSRQDVSDFPSGVGFTRALRFQRTAANADVAVIRLGQALESGISTHLAGRRAVLSFWARRGANFSPTGAFVGVTIATGTGTDGSAANLVSGGWTGYAAQQVMSARPGVVQVASPNGGTFSGITSQAVLTNVSGVNLTTDWARYQLVVDVPNAARQIGVLFNVTPVGTAGANDWYEISGIQLEAVAPENPYASLFERRSPQLELMLCQRYFWRLNEPATAAAVVANGMISATNVETVAIPTPVPMRVAPTVAVVAGAFRFNIAGSLTAVGAGFAGGADATQSTTCINVVGAVTATVGQATQLVSGASTWGGSVSANAEL